MCSFVYLSASFECFCLIRSFKSIKAGRTLQDFKADFKPDLHPRMIGGVAQFEACRKQFFVQTIMSLRLFICTRSRWSIAKLKSYQTCLIFMTLDRAASDMIPAIAN